MDANDILANEISEDAVAQAADIAQDRPGVKEHEDPFARGLQNRKWARRRFDRPATSQGAIGPERRFRPGT